MTGTPGPHRKEQPHAKSHFNPFDPSGRYTVVPDKGLDRIFVFRFENGTLEPAPAPWVDSRAGAGPRHLPFHPRAPFVYVANELDSTVTAYRFEIESGALSPFQMLSTLPDTFTGNNTSYASNRGHDSIAVFSVDDPSGRLLFIEAVKSAGRTPRFFTQGLKGRVLLVLNEDSDNIVTFILRDDGRLGSPTSDVRCCSPVCLVL